MHENGKKILFHLFVLYNVLPSTTQTHVAYFVGYPIHFALRCILYIVCTISNYKDLCISAANRYKSTLNLLLERFLVYFLIFLFKQWFKSIEPVLKQEKVNRKQNECKKCLISGFQSIFFILLSFVYWCLLLLISFSLFVFTFLKQKRNEWLWWIFFLHRKICSIENLFLSLLFTNNKMKDWYDIMLT